MLKSKLVRKILPPEEVKFFTNEVICFDNDSLGNWSFPTQDDTFLIINKCNAKSAIEKSVLTQSHQKIGRGKE